ncbi:MAG: isoprenylcysteine carboxylmethyltransferase family protein [Candidatus Aminicenantales bacterium]|jgi:protein-S-isoprenylcysteine O-methyltransferase Ste14
MTKRNVADRILLANPISLSGVEGALLIGTGILGWVFSWPKMPLFPALNVIGGVLFLGGVAFHHYCERVHRQAHHQSDDITRIIKAGAYSKIRHPLYLSMIFVNLGIGLAFGIIWTFILAVLIKVRIVMSALQEEEFLLRKFPEEYRQYKQSVRWRMIPGVF